jgi:hypothetical protein
LLTRVRTKGFFHCTSMETSFIRFVWNVFCSCCVCVVGCCLVVCPFLLPFRYCGVCILLLSSP